MKVMKSLIKVLPIIMASTFAYAEHTAPVFDLYSMSNEAVSQSDNTPAIENNSVSNTEERLNRIEQHLEAMQQSEAHNQTNNMQADIQALRNQVEELQHRLQVLVSKRQEENSANNEMS